MGTPEELPQTLAPGRIGAAAIAYFALAATAPIAVLIHVVPTSYAAGGGPLVPLGFLAAGAVLILFIAGYAAMGHRAPFGGAMYTYVAKGLGRPGGVGAAWLALTSYQVIQLGLYGLAGAAAAPLLRSWFDVGAQWWMVAAGCWLLVTVCGPVRVEVSSGLIALMVLVEGVVIVGFAAANVIDPAGGEVTVASIRPSEVDMPVLGLLLVVAVLAFAGFETSGAYAEEAIRPRRDPGRSAYLTVVVVAVLLAGASWSLSTAAGPGRIAELARARGPELLFDLAAARLAPWAVTLGRLMLLTGLVAAMLALHHTIARYLFALGRERVLPAGLSRTSPRTWAPRNASLTQSLIAGVALLAAYAIGISEVDLLGRRLIVAGGLGVLVLLIATSLAALLHLNRVPNGEGAWSRFVAPVLATVALGVIGYLALGDVRLLGTPSWIVPAAIGGVALLGVLHALLLRRLHPVIYAGIGQSGVPVVVTPPRLPQQRPHAEPGAHRPERVNR
ncbi:APC family permease [Paractinoplanes atraurantiacus]|uniref:Amino acid transporter n=1 Tax=Paractinoplanes atraurantiacus TaxID=1036182 RepID=A0A285KPZ5_9ACTN|nr:APC family permease [Actinoplanes atraurantiacus]SNY74283.1 Amino acid transporter [Actinoplanes atraurantiacus]